MLALSLMILNLASVQAGTASESRVIDYLRPMLEQPPGPLRVYYVGECRPAEFDTSGKLQLLFPTVSLQPPSPGSTGVDAIRQAFRSDGNVRVTQDRSRIIRITIGNVPTALLQTEIPRLAFSSSERYSAPLAMLHIEDAPEVRAAEDTLNVRPMAPIIDIIVSGPMPGEPHLSQSIGNVSVDEALDSVARTFKGIVTFGTCKQTGGEYLFDLHWSP